MAFSFGFGGDDVVDEGADAQPHAQPETSHSHAGVSDGDTRPAQQHALEDLLATLPDRLSYSTVRVESPTGREALLPRRELFDVRAQLLGEGGAENEDVVAQIEQADIRAGVYEGGFKTWECAQDLAALLLDRGPRKDIDELVRCDQVIELGAGTALPSLILFRHALANSIPITFILADYNDSVLRLVTLPNLLLTWAFTTTSSNLPALSTTPGGDLDLDPSMLSAFTADLAANNITLTFLSGAWSPALASLIPPSAPEAGTLVLAAETIYSPASTQAFTETLVAILQRTKMAKAVIGAKRVYFGVGGSVDGLKEACRELGAVAYEVENHGVVGMDIGVGRALVEVQMY